MEDITNFLVKTSVGARVKVINTSHYSEVFAYDDYRRILPVRATITNELCSQGNVAIVHIHGYSETFPCDHRLSLLRQLGHVPKLM